MSPLTANSFTSLDEFPLGWRFTPQRLARAAGEIASKLRPIAPESAAHLARVAAERAQQAEGEMHAFRSDDSPAAVQVNLRALPVDPGTEIILSWNPSTALTTDWATFVAHWDDFCYPASDDVAIWAVGAEWTLRYHHYEVFQFWRAPEQVRGTQEALPKL